MAFTARLQGRSGEGEVPILTFFLEIDEEGDVGLWCEDEDGESWSLLCIEAETGQVVLVPSVSEHIGLDVKKDGRLVVQE